MKNFLRSLIAPVVVGLLAVATANGAICQWSKTAPNNATADPSINWAEGMSPSSVNDSARVMMKVIADWRDDMSGLLTTSGNNAAYTLTTNSGLPSPPTNGQMIAFTPHTTNAATATMAVDGGSAYAIQTAPGIPIGAGVILEGSPYRVKFSTANSAWMLEAVYNLPSGVPLGSAVAYTGSTAPSSNYILAYGQCISRTTYAEYFAIVSTTYGACDGTTTFGVPDMRGRVVAGKDDMGGTSANRLTNQTGGVNGDVLGATGGAETHTLTTAQIAAHNHTGTTDSAGDHTHTVPFTGFSSWAFGSTAPGVQQGGPTSTSSSGAHTHTFTTGNTGGGGAHNNVQPTIIFSYLIRIM